MFGFRLNPPGPFWFEDLVYSVIDETRRLPQRAGKAISRLRDLADDAMEKAAAFDPTALVRKPFAKASAPEAIAYCEVPQLDGEETWALATEPLAAVGTGTSAAIAFHQRAAEQLDSLTYVLERMREDLRPMMTYARFEGDNVHTLHATPDLETSIEALLELSRKNAATRPKDRTRTAA